MMDVLPVLWNSTARHDLIRGAALVAASCAIATAVVLWASSEHRRATNTHDEQLAVWSADTTTTADSSDLASSLDLHAQRAGALQNTGFTSAVDRVAWIEAVENRLRPLRAASYTVEVGLAESLPLPDSLQTRYVDRGLVPPTLEFNDMTLRMQGVHEEEWMIVVEAAQSGGGGVTRIERCKLIRRADEQGIDTECVLRRFHVVDATPETTS